jgi:NRPS condensation-like uncharacterized protein
METLNHRPFGATEKLFWLLDQTSPVHFVIAAEVSGHINPFELREALAQIQRRHPLLASRIVANGFENPYVESVPNTPIPLRIIDKTSRDTLSAEMARELATPFDWTQAPLIRCALLHDSLRSVLLFTLHHTISDGISMTLVIRDLLRALTGQKVAPLTLSLSIDQLLNLEPLPTTTPTSAVHWGEHPLSRREESEPHVTLANLPVALSASVIAKAKAERTTVQGALYAAAVLGARLVSDSWHTATLKVIIPISIRDAINAQEGSGLYITSKALLAEYTDELDFWKLARFAKKELTDVKDLETIKKNALAAQSRLFSGTAVQALSEALQKGVARQLMITNLGRVSYEPSFGKHRLEHIWGPLALSGTPDEITIGVTTVNDILCLSTATRAGSFPFLAVMINQLEAACNP